MRYEIQQIKDNFPVSRTLYLIIDTQHDMLVDSFDTMAIDDARMQATIRADALNCVLGYTELESYDD